MVTVVREAQFHRRREAAQQRRQRLFGDVDEGERLLGFGDREDPGSPLRRRFAGKTQGNFTALAVEQAEFDGNHERQFFNFVRGWRAALAEGQAVGFRRGIIRLAYRQTRCASLAVPAFELGQVDAIGIFHGLDEVIAGHGLAVMALEIQVAAFAEAFGAKQGVDHADHFRALFVHGQGVEVGDLDEAVRAYRRGPWDRRLRRTGGYAGRPRPGCA